MMAADEDLKIHRNEPPHEGEDWQRLHRAAWRADQTWLISRPIVAIASNWKALVGLGILIAWANRPDIMAAFQVLMGVPK